MVTNSLCGIIHQRYEKIKTKFQIAHKLLIMHREVIYIKYDNLGFLTVRAVTANGALPVADATVHIYEYPDEFDKERTDILYSLRTDSSGKTDKIALDAKDKELSLSPDNVKPYTTYNITVEKDGFYASEKLNVPIFQGITSVQTVEMIPLSEFSDPYSATPDYLGRFTDTKDQNGPR